MKNTILLFSMLLILPAMVFAIPVTYTGNIHNNTADAVDTLHAISVLSETTRDINQTALITPFNLNHLENPNVLVEFMFKNLIVRRYTQPLPGSIVDLHDILVGVPDVDLDGVKDATDNCVYVPNNDQADVAPANGIGDVCDGDIDGDIDGDGVPDATDTLTGDANLIVTNILHLALLVDNSTNTAQPFTGVHNVTITNGTHVIIEFSYDFSVANLSMPGTSIIRRTDGTLGGLTIRGTGLAAHGIKKTVYVERVGRPYICIIDSEPAGIYDLPPDNCASGLPLICPGASSDYVCDTTDAGTRFKISGLSYTSLTESTYTPPVPPQQQGISSGCIPVFSMSAPSAASAAAGSSVTIPVTVSTSGTCGGTATVTTTATAPAGWVITSTQTAILGANNPTDTVDILLTLPSDAVTSTVTFIARISNRNYTATTTINVGAAPAVPTTPTPTTPTGEQAIPITGQATAPVTGQVTGNIIADNPTLVGGIGVVVIIIVGFVAWKLVKGRGKRGNLREIKAGSNVKVRVN